LFVYELDLSEMFLEASKCAKRLQPVTKKIQSVTERLPCVTERLLKRLIIFCDLYGNACL